MENQNLKEKQKEMLQIRLKGIVQKWSKDGWVNNVLKTEPIPTKKGVMNLCGCALGIRPWGSSENEQEIEELNQQITLYYSPDESQEGTICEDSFYLEDDYDGTKIECVQQIIVNADFIMYVGAEPELLRKLHEAFRHPVYITCLGDHDCMPSCVISKGDVFVDVNKNLIEVSE